MFYGLMQMQQNIWGNILVDLERLVIYGNRELGINTETGIVYHARMIY